MSRCLPCLILLATFNGGCLYHDSGPVKWIWTYHFDGRASNLLGCPPSTTPQRQLAAEGFPFLLTYAKIVRRDPQVLVVTANEEAAGTLLLRFRADARPGIGGVTASTESGTLDAFLVRPPPEQFTSLHYTDPEGFHRVKQAWQARLDTLAADPAAATGRPDAIPFAGRAEVRLRKSEQDVLTLRVDLTSVGPMPLHTAFFQERLRLETEMSYIMPPTGVPRINGCLDRPDQVPATIRGAFNGYWQHTGGLIPL